MFTEFTVISGYFLVIVSPETVTVCRPIGTDENNKGVTSPVSFPSKVIAAPGGSLATFKNPARVFFKYETYIGGR